MVCTKSPIGWRRRTAAFCVARAVARGNLVILASWVLRSTRVSKPPLCPALTTVSPSQSPRRVLRATMAGRSEMSILLGITLVITFSAPPKTAPQVAAVAFVIPDHLVDAFMAQLDALFAQPATDLLWRPAHLAQLRLNLAAHQRRELAGLTSYRLACLRLRFRLLEPIAALTAIALNLPAHRALTDA